VATGKKVMSSAADNLKRVTLELGNNDAGIVLPGTAVDALLDDMRVSGKISSVRLFRSSGTGRSRKRSPAPMLSL